MRRHQQWSAGKMTHGTDMMQYRKMCKAAMAGVPIAAYVHDKITVPARKIPINEISSVIGNLCTFSCPNCEKATFSNWSTIKYHFKKAHQQRLTYISFDLTLKQITDAYNKNEKIIESNLELHGVDAKLREGLDTLINRGENLDQLRSMAENLNFETKAMSRKAKEIKRKELMDQYKIYLGIIILIIMIYILFLRR